MFAKLKLSFLSAATGLCFALALPAQASVVYNNLDALQSGSDAIYGTGPLANSFSTGTYGGTLNSIQALLMNLGPDLASNLQVSLLSSNSGTPGSVLATFDSLSSASISSTGFESYRFSLASGYSLAANTTYWIEITSIDPSAVQWSFSSDLTGVGVASESSYSAAFGVSPNGTAALDGFGPYQMAVELPEPGSLALIGLGFGAMVWVRRRS